MQNQLGLGLQGRLSILHAKGFIPKIIYTDPAKGFTGLIGAFPGVLVDTSGAGDNIPKFDAKIRRIKKLYRSVKNGLPWTLPLGMIKDLVAYALSRLNICRTTALNENVCPKVLFTGMKVNYKRELEIAFGDYCEVNNGTDNTSASRSVPCIALYPANNSTGSWEFMNLTTKTRVKRSQWKAMVTTEFIIDVMNHFEDKNLLEVPQEVHQPTAHKQPTQVKEQDPVPAETQATEQVEPEIIEDVPDLVDPGPDSESEDEDDNEEEPAEEVAPIASRTRQRSGTQTQPPSRYTMAVKEQKRHKTPERREAIEKAYKNEIKLLFVDLQGLKPVSYEEIKKSGVQVYNSHMFSVEKFMPTVLTTSLNHVLFLTDVTKTPNYFPIGHLLQLLCLH